MGFDPRNGSTQQCRSGARQKLLDQLEEARKDGATASGVLYFWNRAPLLTQGEGKKSFEMVAESFIIYDGVSPPLAEIFDEEIIEEKMMAVLDSTITSPDVCQLVNTLTVE